MNAEQRIKSLGIQLPTGSGPAGNYATAVQSGQLLFLSGKAPLPVDGVRPRGRIGSDYSTEQGRELARSACIDLLATIRHELGSLDRVERIVEQSYHLLHDACDRNRVVHFSRWTSLAQAKAFFESDLLVEIRRLAGVEAPEFNYLHSLEQATL